MPRRCHSAALAAITLLTLLTPLLRPAPAAAQTAGTGSPGGAGLISIECQPSGPIDPAPASFTPWFYERGNGELVWGRHQFYEDPANTVFVLSRELIALSDQTGTYPEALLFNFAQFDPPEGIDNGQPRRLMGDSIAMKGLQLYVNYSDRLIDSSQGNQDYFNPTFFISLDGHQQNSQTLPAVPWSGFSPQLVSATRGAFGCAKVPVGANRFGACDDVYVTAGLGYGLAELDPDPGHQASAAEAERDRLMWRDLADPQQRWMDISQETACPGGAPRIPAAVAAGNNSGVAFADLNGDGRADLYIGRSGDSYLGAANVLLINDGTGCFTDQTATLIPNQPVRATQEVAAADLDLDGDLDLVVANRCRRGPASACGTESEDYALINRTIIPCTSPPICAVGQPGRFDVVGLNAGQLTDSRSVAVGDLNQDGWPEIVFGNAGSDGLSNTLGAPQVDDHPTQIFFNQGAPVFGGAVNTFVDKMTSLINPANEEVWTRPWTQQVLLVDIFSPKSSPPAATDNQPDGWLDLVFVNHRDILKHETPFSASSRVHFLANDGGWSDPDAAGFELKNFTTIASPWVRAVGLADFTGNGFLDALQARGNRFSGVQGEVHENLGTAAPPGTGGSFSPWNVNPGFIGDRSYETNPGNERGYGFDFADLGDDGYLEALQTSRGYDYLVRHLLDPLNATRHEDLAPGFSGNGITRNQRGRLQPRGMEDGVFADFDGDGDLDAVLASQRTPSTSWPISAKGSATPDTLVLVNDGLDQLSFDTVGNPFASVDDARIDLVNRVTHPNIADRAEAADMDNDGDVDAMVHLFELGSQPIPPPNDTLSFGWRYLENIVGEPGAGALWFRDVAPVKMKNSAGQYDGNWNRGLGMDVVGDFDNNGALDYYTTVGFAKKTGEVANVQMTDDLLFLNGTGGQPFGVLTDASNKLPPRCQDVVQDKPQDPSYISCGSFGLVQGDVDNDGDADVVVTHYSQTGRTNYPWLLINRLSETVGPGAGTFTDEYPTRVPLGQLSDIIHTADQDLLGANTLDMDYAMFPALLDFDADGDLDLALLVVDDLPRMLENTGADTNGDGLIDAADASPPGTFTDVTDTLLTAVKPTTDSQDWVAVDIDGDGDPDLANDPFNDMVTLWRNDREPAGLEPVVTEAWPRVGAIKGTTLRLHGVRLTQVVKVELRFAGGAVCTQTAVTPVGTAGTRLDVTIPATCPVGLAQLRVLRQWIPAGCTNRVSFWSRQYFGYFVLDPAP